MRLVHVDSRSQYILVTVRSDWKEMQEAGKWCLQHRCGKEVGISLFGFKTQEELTMFRLRWETE